MRGIDMNLREFHGIDLNLLVAFDALMAERSVVRAAEKVFIGQPAMSHALSRLRVMLDDPLLVRAGNHMEPTAFAKELAPRVHDWLSVASAFLADRSKFDPRRIDATLRIGIPDGLEAILFPPLVARIRRDAPGLILHARQVSTDAVLRALDAEEIDLAVGHSSEAPRQWHCQTVLITSRFDCLYCPAQLFIPAQPSLASLAEHDHVAYSYRGEVVGLIDGFFESRGLQRRIAAIAASLTAVRRIVIEAPLVSIQPRIYAPLYENPAGRESERVAVVPLLEPDLNLQIGMIWHRRNNDSALHTFLRGLVAQLMPS